jgi:hypothetical protein
LYEPGVVGAVAVQVYDPSDRVVLVTMLVLQLNTHTIGSFPNPPPLAVRAPETVNVVPPPVEPDGNIAVSEVDTGLLSEAVFRFSVILPGPLNVTKVGSFEPEQVRP